MFWGPYGFITCYTYAERVITPWLMSPTMMLIQWLYWRELPPSPGRPILSAEAGAIPAVMSVETFGLTNYCSRSAAVPCLEPLLTS
jgi:hypothetical protein